MGLTGGGLARRCSRERTGISVRDFLARSYEFMLGKPEPRAACFLRQYHELNPFFAPLRLGERLKTYFDSESRAYR